MTDPHDSAGSDEFDDDGGLFDDVDADGVPDVRAAAPRKLVLTFGVALAVFVFIGVAGATLLVFLVLRIRDHADPNHTVRATYSHRYTSCVQSGGTADDCSTQVLIACEKDPWWTQPARTGQRETICLAASGKD